MSRIRLNRDYYYMDLVEDAAYLKDAYPDILSVQEIGASHDGRKIIMLCVGRGKKNIICCSGVHGRESMNPIVLMKMTEYYAEMHQGEKKVDIHSLWHHNMVKLLEHYRICFIPLLNPDGYMVALKGFSEIRDKNLRMSAENKKIPYKEWKYNARGIDINRNFPSSSWQGVGGRPESEMETETLIQVFHSMKSIGFLDYHSRGKRIYYYRHAMSSRYNKKQKEIALNLAKVTGYQLALPEEELDEEGRGGNTIHYYSENFKNPAVTIETVEEEMEFPLDVLMQKDTFHEILKTPFLLCR